MITGFIEGARKLVEKSKKTREGYLVKRINTGREEKSIKRETDWHAIVRPAGDQWDGAHLPVVIQ